MTPQVVAFVILVLLNRVAVTTGTCDATSCTNGDCQADLCHCEAGKYDNCSSACSVTCTRPEVCNTTGDTCVSCNPLCANTGECRSTTDGPKCLCEAEYGGDNCGTKTCDTNDDCVHGTCGTDKFCDCNTGFTGDLCDTTPCHDTNDPCQNGGTCTGEVCQCTADFTGDRCQNGGTMIMASFIVFVGTAVVAIVFW